MKKFLSLISVFLIVTLSVVNSTAVDFNYGLAVNDKVQTGKTFNAEIIASGVGNIAAVIFTVCFDPKVVEYKSASLSEGIDAKLETNGENSQVKLVFLNVHGQNLKSESTGIINLRFKALSTPCNAFITIYGEQAVNVQEHRLSCKYGEEYPIEFMDKLNGPVSLSKGRTVSSSKSTSSSKNNKSKSKSDSDKIGDDLSDEDPKGNGTTSYGSAGDSSFNSAWLIFLVIAVICLVCGCGAVFVFYKKRAKQKISDSDTDMAAESDDDKPI